MRLLFALSAAVILGACSSNGASTATMPDAGSDGPSPNDAATDAHVSGTCATLPANAKLVGGGCTGVSGTFTQATFDTVANTYDETCGAPVYKDQAEFDLNEGTSGAPGTTLTSHEDYVVTSTCASGSVDYQTTGSAKTTIVFIWTKVP